MKNLISRWKQYLSKEDLEERILNFCMASPVDKECMISEAYGIFDGSLSGNVYTYYFYDCDTLNYKYHGTKNWHKGADCYRVDYNFSTDELMVTKCKRWNSRATENRCRML